MVRTKPDDGHEWSKHVVLILILIFKNIHPSYHTSCVIDCPPIFLIYTHNGDDSRSLWPRGLRRRSTAARPLRLWVRIPPGAWMFVCCECCVLSGRGFYDGLVTRPEDSYRLWRVVVCDQETSKTRRLKPATGL